MANHKQTLLIVEDDLDVAEMLNAYFRAQGYEVLTAEWGEDGIKTAISASPDLIILDIQLPDMEGFDVARKLRSTNRTAGIPIIFLTDQREKAKRLKGLGLGADDYITKPFDIQELRLRVRNSLRRVHQGSTNNLITNLPESAVVEEYLQDLTADPHKKSLLLVRIMKLDAFREAYGFITSDDVLRAITLMIQSVVHEFGNNQDLIGHTDKTDIIIISSADKTKTIEEQIRSRMPHSIELFYPVSDRDKHHANRLFVKISVLNSSEIKAAGSIEKLKEKLGNNLD